MATSVPGMGVSGGSALAEVRARQALRDAGLDPTVPLERTSSVTNEVWLTPDLVIRVNRSTHGRLKREAELAPFLPNTVRYPEIIARGGIPGKDWLLLRRMLGRPIAHVWPELDKQQRRRAISEVVTMLRAVHKTREPIGLPPIENLPHLLDLGSDPVVAPLLSGLDRVRMLEHIDPAVVGETVDLVKDTGSALGRFVVPTLIHGDLTFENVLWHDGHAAALLDFEWSRAAPHDLELDIVLRFCAYPFLHVAPEYEERTMAEDWAKVPQWLMEDYPELLSFPQQLERLRLYSIAYDVRELLLFPPHAPARDLSPYHPYHRLRRVLQQRSYLEDLRPLLGS